MESPEKCLHSFLHNLASRDLNEAQNSLKDLALHLESGTIPKIAGMKTTFSTYCTMIELVVSQ